MRYYREQTAVSPICNSHLGQMFWIGSVRRFRVHSQLILQLDHFPSECPSKKSCSPIWPKETIHTHCMAASSPDTRTAQKADWCCASAIPAQPTQSAAQRAKSHLFFLWVWNWSHVTQAKSDRLFACWSFLLPSKDPSSLGHRNSP